MDTVKLMQWREEFDAIMSEEYLDNRIADRMRDLHTRYNEQPDMWDESTEEETERML